MSMRRGKESGRECTIGNIWEKEQQTRKNGRNEKNEEKFFVQDDGKKRKLEGIFTPFL